MEVRKNGVTIARISRVIRGSYKPNPNKHAYRTQNKKSSLQTAWRMVLNKFSKIIKQRQRIPPMPIMHLRKSHSQPPILVLAPKDPGPSGQPKDIHRDRGSVHMSSLIIIVHMVNIHDEVRMAAVDIHSQKAGVSVWMAFAYRVLDCSRDLAYRVQVVCGIEEDGWCVA